MNSNSTLKRQKAPREEIRSAGREDGALSHKSGSESLRCHSKASKDGEAPHVPLVHDLGLNVPGVAGKECNIPGGQ